MLQEFRLHDLLGRHPLLGIELQDACEQSIKQWVFEQDIPGVVIALFQSGFQFGKASVLPKYLVLFL